MHSDIPMGTCQAPGSNSNCQGHEIFWEQYRQSGKATASPKYANTPNLFGRGHICAMPTSDHIKIISLQAIGDMANCQLGATDEGEIRSREDEDTRFFLHCRHGQLVLLYKIFLP